MRKVQARGGGGDVDQGSTVEKVFEASVCRRFIFAFLRKAFEGHVMFSLKPLHGGLVIQFELTDFGCSIKNRRIVEEYGIGIYTLNSILFQIIKDERLGYTSREGRLSATKVVQTISEALRIAVHKRLRVGIGSVLFKGLLGQCRVGILVQYSMGYMNFFLTTFKRFVSNGVRVGVR